MKYELYIDGNGKKRVKFLNCKHKSGKCVDYSVKTDKDGREYFAIPNIKNPKNLFLFCDRIKDAIESIRNGEGDCLRVNTTGCALFGGDSVYRYVDRKYGEELRQKTIEGFKDAQFGYGLKFGFKNSFSGGSLLDINNKRFYGFENQEQLKFKTKEEAEKYKEDMLKDVKRINDRIELLKINNPNKLEKFFKNILNKKGVEFYMMNDENGNTEEYYLNVVQVIL